VYTGKDLRYRTTVIITFFTGAALGFGAFFYVSQKIEAHNISRIMADEPHYEAMMLKAPGSPMHLSVTVVTAKNTPLPNIVPVQPIKKPIILSATTSTRARKKETVFSVPFYSQFRDISDTDWQKRGCGIASLAMVIDFYKPNEVSPDTLLSEGIASRAYQVGAGWIHRGLARLANDHNLAGTSYDLAKKDVDTAFVAFTTALEDGPLIASVHYKFEPNNPIPHLVVITGISGDRVYYHDPAGEKGGSISKDTFKRAWKKRYIAVRPAT